MEEVEYVTGPIYFLCLDCWFNYFQSVDEIPSAPFQGQCSTCMLLGAPLIACKSDSPLARRYPLWEDETGHHSNSSEFFGAGRLRCRV